VERICNNFKTEVNGFSHPNILQTYGVITSSTNFLTIVMAFAPDSTLRELLDVDLATPLSKETQMDYVTQLCHGFIYLHAKKVARMDFKSLNVLRSVAVVCMDDMHVCVCVCTCACMYRNVKRRLYQVYFVYCLCVHQCMYLFIYILMIFIFTHIYIYIFICMFVYMCVYINTCVRACVCV